MNKQTKSKTGLFLQQCMITLLLGSGVTIGLLYLAAFIIVNKYIPRSAFFAFATVCVCLGCAFSSMVLAMQRKAGGLLAGFICFMIYAIILIVGTVICGGLMFSTSSILRLVLLCSGGLVGGGAGVNYAKKRLRRRHRA